MSVRSEQSLDAIFTCAVEDLVDGLFGSLLGSVEPESEIMASACDALTIDPRRVPNPVGDLAHRPPTLSVPLLENLDARAEYDQMRRRG